MSGAEYEANSADVTFKGESLREKVLLIANDSAELWRHLVASGRFRASAWRTIHLDESERDLVTAQQMMKDIVVSLDQEMSRHALRRAGLVRGGKMVSTTHPRMSAETLRMWASAVGIDVGASLDAPRGDSPEDEARMERARAKRARKAAARRIP